eukprot:Gregarina_sp_Poly_1__1002@NODE_1244_length_4647_cov_43_825546_g848_i0_p2_GENE_NODE_1244_length_4647_cov_43_825546_g848_i0NODE_1244_length_4647_cov_43_825546_g848_i0_p2_ORF_typecomplete_len377_score57_33DUF2981/PF11200_8/3_6e22YfhO/PF09586_10/0_0048YfhO/PF09586_10/2_8e03Claudin_2/PF13903_6/0_28Claudin_2/PF13903_6/35TMCCDC2/PF15844_5/0_3Transp_cyt_pur/PF02133_15/0_071Transp_cyt_pur/PF02133_15/1_3e03Tetraspanin/PF00335_20/5_7Tetraspanin/PF00335_20/667TMRDISM_7TM/PF07695_11/0_27TMRDISM_7TM/PF07695_1
MKAKKFAGYFSLKTGCAVAAVVNACIGVVIWQLLGYLRPQLVIISLTIFGAFLLVCIIGLIATWKRSVALMWTFAVLTFGLTVLTLLLGLDFLDAIDLLPTPPSYPTSADDVKAFSSLAYAATGNLISSAGNDAHTETASSFMGSHKTSRSKVVPLRDVENDIAANVASLLLPWVAPFSISSDSALGDDNDDTIRQILEGPDRKRRYKLRMKLHPTKPKGMGNWMDTQQSLLQQHKPEDHGDWASSAGVKEAAPGMLVRAAEGQKEEVSLEELAPEVADLPEDLQKSVTATTKMLKHLVKFTAGIVLLGLSLWMTYSSWVITSFALNRCISFDVLEEQPDQFEPLMLAEYSSEGLPDVSQLKIDDDIDLKPAPPPP